ncbi:MAG: CoA transferase [Chloroflexota bacterium]
MALALEGIKVIEAATMFAGPMAGRLLADWGADVIHIEHPVRGDIMRGIFSPTMTASPRAGTIIQSQIDYDTETHNCNKRSLTLDLGRPRGQQIMHKMLETTDVFLTNFRPRELKKFNAEYETLSKINPRLIYADVTGYGKKGPDKDAPGYDFLAFWARSGFLHTMLTANMQPIITPLAAGDRLSGMALALGIMTALFVRERTGIGQEVTTSLFNTGIFAIACDVGGALVTGKDIQQVPRQEVLNACATFYQTKDKRWLRLGMVQTDPYWAKLCQALGRPELENDPRFNAFAPRMENRAALFAILEETFLTRPLTEWKERLDKAGLPWGVVQNLPEVVNDPQARANDFFVACEHPTYGHIEMVANPVKLSKTPASIRTPAPEFSQHTEEILLEHGYTWEDIAQFKDEQIIA